LLHQPGRRAYNRTWWKLLLRERAMKRCPSRNSGRVLVAALAFVLFAVAVGGLIVALYLGAPEVEVPPASEATSPPVAPSQPASQAQPGEDAQLAAARHRMVEEDLRGRDITDRRVLAVMGRIPRHRFVSEAEQRSAYADHPLPIGHGQTISQPYIVALMTQLARPDPDDRALDVGTGSGYQAAVLAELCKRVYSIEIVRPLAKQARQRLADLGYKNVTVRRGDGYRGWAEHAPFDLIIVAAAPDHVPQPLVDQLAPGGRLVIPVGRYFQELVLIEKHEDGTIGRKTVANVAFVPMTGEAEKKAEH
jgi:protein-L-isoaspartate(D-aspartate) O-methyltransferase